MGVLRQLNVLGQMRLDVPHLRSLDSSIAADFDLLAGRILAGAGALVVRGFEISMNTAIGNPATSLQMVVAGGTLMHALASEAGTLFVVDDAAPLEPLAVTNSRVVGGFTANADNFVGIDLRRIADATTADVVMFIDANTRLQSPKTIPLARTLDYRIVISTTDFAATPHICPVAKVTTDSSNLVTAIADTRQMWLRLGRGGSSPDRAYAYPFIAGRSEGTSGTGIFQGGDKQLLSDKDWRDAIMTRLWEVGGGQYWYSPNSDRDVKLVKGQPVIVATGDNFQWTLGSSTLQWASLSFEFANSTGTFNDVADGSAVIADGQCLYVDLDRTTNRTGGTALVPAVANLATLGTPIVPGTRYIIAWRKGSLVYVRDRDYEVSRVAAVATNLTQGTVKLSYAAGTPSDPVVAPLDVNGAVTATATAGNSFGLRGIGQGTGEGVRGTGGGTSGAGVKGTGGAPNGIGVKGVGTGVGAGVSGDGGNDVAGAPGVSGGGGTGGGAGVYGFNRAATAPGVKGEASQAGTGVEGIGGSTNGTIGVTGASAATNGRGGNFTGSGTGQGATGTGGGTNGTGLEGTGGATNGIGVLGSGAGSGSGVKGIGASGSAIGVEGIGGTSSGTGVAGTGGTANGKGVLGTGTGTGVGVFGAGGSGGGAGVHGEGTGTNGLGVEGVGFGSGVGVRAVAGGATAVQAVGDITIADGSGPGAIDWSAATQIAKTTAVVNRLPKRLVPKAWGYVKITGAGGTTLTEACNITSVTGIDIPNGLFEILFPTGFVDNDSYIVQVESEDDTGGGALEVRAVRANKDATHCRFRVYDTGGAAAHNCSIGASIIRITITVWGLQ